MPCVRAVATSKPNPTLASQAEKASRIIGVVVAFEESNCKAQRESVTKSDSIMPSRHRSAERRWRRWRAKPVSPRANAVDRAK